ncbi:STAM-binding protein [Entomortierella parvispora]|uniref:STAM-binding protein n=1 Tax=Entomortierella parvispora TaxID=205924 RepID=A0A9P3H8T8_9FUNG|nr:STAM-binding protein [Entomortierella parvispora]
MKFTVLLSVTALMAMAAAQSADVTAEPSLDVNYADPGVDDSISTPINYDYNDIIDQPSNEMPDDENLNNDVNDDIDNNYDDDTDNNYDRDDSTDHDKKHGSKKSQFIAWSSPDYKGHKQRTKNTKGCYRLDGGAVGSFEGSSKVQYGFYKDDRCRGQFLFGASYAPVKKIDPVIYPRSVKMFVTEGGDGTPSRPDPSRFSLVAWSRPKFYGDKQLVRGMGCQAMDGSDVYSFQGEYKYKFYANQHCSGRKVLETKGGKSSIPLEQIRTTMRSAKVEKCFSRKELNDRAQVTVVDSTPIRFYIRAAQLLFRQAQIYQNEGDLQTSYIQYMKFCNLAISDLRKHPEHSNPIYKASLSSLRKTAMNALDEIEILKPILDRKYEEYQEYVRQRDEEAMQEALEAQLIHDSQRQIELERMRKEQQDALWAQNMPSQDWSIQKALEGVVGVNSMQHSHHYQHQHPHHGVQEIQYPEHHRQPHHSTLIRQPSLPPTPTGPAPAIPRKTPIPGNVPKLPPKIKIEEDVHEFSEGLRTMIVPIRLLDRFLNIVRPNTLKKLETCGILAGVLSRNKLTVTTLIIPKQTATSDTCSTTNEDELFEFQMERDLMTLGWIHTHPTQTCFMSSVDLHTHCSYQLMLPEAIAIVCAPSHEKDYGVFRLTDPPGLQVITNCRQKPLFHQHPGEDDIYTDACDRGHVELVDMDLDIVDMRNK